MESSQDGAQHIVGTQWWFSWLSQVLLVGSIFMKAQKVYGCHKVMSWCELYKIIEWKVKFGKWSGKQPADGEEQGILLKNGFLFSQSIPFSFDFFPHNFMRLAL